jgi:Ca-activated chloride channel family protein
MIYVIDNSGSMEGESMRQAKAGLLYALTRLRPGDTFNVIRFDNTLESLFDTSVPADGEHLERARAFVSGLQASGGTEMAPALERALTDPAAGEDRRLRQVIFMTDGAISNEQQMFDLIGSRLGRSRVFMVGIGSAPNSHLMSRMAELGRGAFTHIGDPAEVEARMRGLLDRLETPVATNLVASFSEGAESAPGVLPDLYADQPLMLTARVASLSGVLTITGEVRGRPLRIQLPLSQAQPGHGIARLWARRRIEDAEVGVSMQRLTREQADAQILALAMSHHLVSSQTSLVAVDRTPVRPDGAPLTAHDVPLNLPQGWDFEAVFGGEHPSPPASRRGEGASQTQAVDLPQTGTDAMLLLAFGVATTGAALLVLVAALRRPARRTA